MPTIDSENAAMMNRSDPMRGSSNDAKPAPNHQSRVEKQRAHRRKRSSVSYESLRMFGRPAADARLASDVQKKYRRNDSRDFHGRNTCASSAALCARALVMSLGKRGKDEIQRPTRPPTAARIHRNNRQRVMPQRNAEQRRARHGANAPGEIQQAHDACAASFRSARFVGGTTSP